MIDVAYEKLEEEEEELNLEDLAKARKEAKDSVLGLPNVQEFDFKSANSIPSTMLQTLA